MKLSNKKIKYIRRHGSMKTPEAIAKDLRIHVRDVCFVLNKPAGRVLSRTPSAFDAVLHLGLVCVCFLAPFMILKGIWDFANLPQLAFVQIGAVFLLLLWLVRALMGNGCFIVKSPLNFPVLAFILWSLATSSYAHNQYEAFLPWMGWTASALMFFLVLNGPDETRRLTTVLTALFAAGFSVAVLGAVQHLFGFSWIPQVKAPAATFANKNMATHFIILTMPLGVGLFFSRSQKAWIWGVAMAGALMLSFLGYTRTRAGWVALSAEVVFLAVLVFREHMQSKGFAFWSHRKTLAAGSAIVVVLVLVNLGPEGFKWRFGEIVQETATITQFAEDSSEGDFGGDKNIELRKAIWLNTIEMIKDRPWTGWGLGNHKLFYPVYHRKAVKEKFFSETAQLSHVHNDFLQAAAELGMVGMVLLVWLIAALTLMVFRLTSPRYPEHVRVWTMAVATGIIGLMVNAFFSFPFQRAIPPFVFMIFIGTLGAFYAGSQRACYVMEKKWLILGSIFIVLAVWLCLIRFHSLAIRADRHFLHLAQFEKAGKWSAVISEGKKAHAYNPSRTKVLSYLGRAYVETGNHEEAVKALQKVIEAYPNHMNALLNLGVAYGSTGEHEKALKVYESVLAIKPDYGKVHNNMGNIYMKQNKTGQAIKEFELAAGFDPTNGVIHFNVGTAKAHVGRYQEAAEAFEAAVKYKKGWALAHKRLGVLYLQHLGRKDDGIAHLKKALELNPGMKDAASVHKVIDRFETGNP